MMTGNLRVPSMVLLALTTSIGCGHKNVKDENPYTPERVASVMKDLKYHKVIVRPISLDKGLEEDDGEKREKATADCQAATLDFLSQKKIFSSVQVSPDAPGDADTLVVQTSVQALRIVGGGARFWAGAFAGSSHMTLLVVAKDSSGTTVGQRAVSNENNAVGAAWTFGASDRGLPGDMGQLVADSIIRLAQTQQGAGK